MPRSHYLKFLRSLAEDHGPRLVEVWPCTAKPDRRRGDLTKRAYVEARCSAAYAIDSDDLQATRLAVTTLRETVEAVSREWFDGLRQKADPGSPPLRRLRQIKKCQQPILRLAPLGSLHILRLELCARGGLSAIRLIPKCRADVVHWNGLRRDRHPISGYHL